MSISSRRVSEHSTAHEHIIQESVRTFYGDEAAIIWLDAVSVSTLIVSAFRFLLPSELYCWTVPVTGAPQKAPLL